MSLGDDAIVRFDRNTATGALTPAGCIADVGDAAGCGTTQQGLDGALRSPSVPTAGRSTSRALDDDAVVRFDRNTTTGALTPAGCIADAGSGIGCGTTQQGLDGAASVAVSPDGRSVYAASLNDAAIVRFDRNTTTGALTPAGCIADAGDAAGCGTTQQGLGSADSVAVSPDGRSVYVASYGDDAIVRFDRNTTTGALTPAGCIADAGERDRLRRHPAGPRRRPLGRRQSRWHVDLRPGYDDDAVVRFDRNTTTGALTPAGCIADAGSAIGCGTTQQGLNGAISVDVSRDGESVYVASNFETTRSSASTATPPPAL